jgi:hypothetical protein
MVVGLEERCLPEWWVSGVEAKAHTMLRTRLYIECPNCYMQYLMKDFGLTYSNGAYIEDVAGAPEWQRLLCPCRPGNPHNFKLRETTQLHVFSQDESERTHFLRPKNKPPILVPATSEWRNEKPVLLVYAVVAALRLVCGVRGGRQRRQPALRCLQDLPTASDSH